MYHCRMDGTKRVGFFFLVLFFAGSVVLMAARELRDKALARGEGTKASAQALIKRLRGEYIHNVPGAYAAPDRLPTRTKGGLLQDNDRQSLNSLVRQVVPAPEEP